MATIKPRRGTSTPGTGAIIQNELAVDTTNKRIFIGAANGSGTLIGSAPAGSDTQIQFNDGGFLGGDAGLTFNKTTDDLTIGGDLNVNGGDIFTTQTTATIFNTTATTVNIGGAATTMAIGNTATAAQTVNMFTGSTGASTYNFATGVTGNATTKTLNIGTGGDAGSTTNINIGSNVGGTTTINSSTVVGSALTQNVFNTVATTVNIGGAATTMAIGNTATAAQTVNMFTASTGASTYNFATGATANATTKTLNIGTGGAAGSATNINIGSSIGGTTTINSGTVVGAATTQNVFNTVATTVNAFGVATAITMGDATTATTTIRGGTLVGNTTTQNVFNTTATTLNLGGAANSVVIGSTSATVNLRGGTLIGSQTTQNVFNTVATTINAFGGATSACNIGPTTGSVSLRAPAVYVGSGNATISTAIGTGLGLSLTTTEGNINLSPSTALPGTGTATSLIVTNGQNASGTVNIDGGNLYLGRKSTDNSTFSAVDIVFEGSVDDANETTLTVANPTADRTITLPDATGTVALTANNLSVFAATTSAQLAGVINDETGFTSGALLVFNTSPSFTTSVVTGSASFDVFNTTATTLNAFGAATTLSIGYNSTAASTTNISTGAVAASTTKTINIGTGGAASSTTNINIGSSNGGTLTSNCPMVSPRLARVSSSAFDTRTGSFSPADTDNGKVFVINISGKTTATVTLDSLSVGWRARFLILGGSGVTFTSTGGTVFGSFGTGGGGNSALTEVVEVYCYATNSYIAS